MDILENLKNCETTTGKISYRKIPKTLKDEIYRNTCFLDEFDSSISERIYCIKNNITSVVRCHITGEKLKYSPNKKQYSNSRKVGYANRKINNHADIKKRLLERLSSIRNTYSSGEFYLMTKEECIQKYDELCPHTNSRISIDIAYNNINLVCSILKHTDFLPYSIDNFSERVYLLTNGISNVVVDLDGLPLKFINSKVGYSKYQNKDQMNRIILDNIKNEVSKNYIVHGFIKMGNKTEKMDLTCKKCNYRFNTFFKNGLWKTIYCSGCYGNPNKSKVEYGIVSYLKEIGIDNIITNDKTILHGKELDIYCPEYKIAIEVDGVLWHSFGKTYPNNILFEKQKKYNSYNKHLKCEKRGIKLITIYDSEWYKKQDIVKSILSSKFGFNKKIYARDCKFRKIENSTANDFLNKTHIQGGCKCSRSYGLFYENELVSVMTFGKRKINRGKIKNEIVRFSTKLGYTVVGGASKLVKNSQEKNFISYCDVRYGSGEVYFKLGMVLSHHTKPNYYYTNDNIKLLHRSNFQKHKISKKGETRTEREIMYDLGYRRIYDCGNLVFEYKKE